MNTYNDYTVKSRSFKNTTKHRSREDRMMSDTQLKKTFNDYNRKYMHNVKNYKRKNSVEKNPLIVELRGRFDTSEDHKTWLDHHTPP